MHHSMLPLIISCTRSWNFAWHLLWRSTTESKNIVKLLAISQTIHTVCCEDDYFPKGKLKLFNSLFHSVYLVFFKKFVFYCRFVCHALSMGRMYRRQMLCCDTARGRHSRRLACLLSSLTFARIACLLQLWIKTSELDYSIWATPK